MGPTLEPLENRALLMGSVIADQATLDVPAGGVTFHVETVSDNQFVFSLYEDNSPSNSFWVYDGKTFREVFSRKDNPERRAIGVAGGYLFYNTYGGAHPNTPSALWAYRFSDGRRTQLKTIQPDVSLEVNNTSRVLFKQYYGLGGYSRLDAGPVAVPIEYEESLALFPLAARHALEVDGARYYVEDNGTATVWKSKLDGSPPSAIFTSSRRTGIVQHGNGVLIVNEDGVYLPNGKHGAFKWFSNAIKFKEFYPSGVSIGTHLIRGSRSLNLTTGESKLLFGAEYNDPIATRISAGAGYAFLLGTGRTDGDYLAPATDVPEQVYAFKGRTLFWDAATSTLRQTVESIRGSVFDDDNRNSLRDGNESASVGVRVYADLNGDGVRQSREPSSLTDSLGRYRLFDVPGRNVTVRVRPDENHYDPGGRRVSLASTSVEKNFGLMPAVKVTGSAFIDMNRNGRWDEFNYGSLDIFIDFWLDLDRDGSADANEPIATTTRSYSFGGLAPGSYQVRARLAQNPPWPLVSDLVFTTPTTVEAKITSGSKRRDFGVYTSHVNPF